MLDLRLGAFLSHGPSFEDRALRSLMIGLRGVVEEATSAASRDLEGSYIYIITYYI